MLHNSLTPLFHSLHSTGKKSYSIFLFIFFLFISLPLSAEEVEIYEEDLRPFIEKFDKGHIDWEEGYYYARVTVPFQKKFRGRLLNKAMQRVMAERVAEALSDSIFLQLAADIRVDAENTLKDLAGDETTIRVMGNIKGREKVSLEEKGSLLKAVYRVPMRGVNGVVSNLYDRVVRKLFSLNKVSQFSKTADEKRAGPVLYIDARGTGALPALFPRILDESNKTVFDVSMMEKERAIKNGVAAYVTTNSHQWGKKSSGPQLLIPNDYLLVRAIGFSEVKKRTKRKRKAIKAIDSMGTLRANIIIGKKDAALIAEKNKKNGFLKKARIVVITEGAIGGMEGYIPYKNYYSVSRPY